MVDENILSAVYKLMEKVADFQLEQQGRAVNIEIKSPKQFVSEVDKQSEMMLKAGLSKILPSAGFFGEETGREGPQCLRWIVDPLDGTTNYLNGLPVYAISVALYQNAEALLGVVYQPATGDQWAAIKDGQFLFNNMPIKSLRSSEVSKSCSVRGLVSTGFPYRSPDLRQSFYGALDYALNVSSGVRRMGSAALDLCHLAMGHYHAFFETDLEPYDVAAGLMFCEIQKISVHSEVLGGYEMGKNRLLILHNGTLDLLFDEKIRSFYSESLPSG
jgi:myo-inositol-1(or 4)-monophosphatase